MRRTAPRPPRGIVQGLSLVLLTVVIVAVFVALEVGWRPSGPGSAAMDAVKAVREAASAMAAARRDPLPEVADGSLEKLVQGGFLEAKLAGGRLALEGGGAVTKVKWIGKKNWRVAWVGVSVEVPTHEALLDLIARARRHRSFQQRPVYGLGCLPAEPPARATGATLCFEL